MATFINFSSANIKTDRDILEQLTDVLQNDISSSATRKKYQVWVTGGVGPGITSSLYQTVFDQDFSLQTANAYFDMTIGLSAQSSIVLTGSFLFQDSTTGKMYFSSQSVQMREKINIYRLFAQELLGDASAEFTTTSGTTSNTIREPLFISLKRLFFRDGIKRETFGIRMFTTGGATLTDGGSVEKIYTDVGSATNIENSYGGEVSTLVDSSNTSQQVGLLYLNKGVIVLDTQRVFDTTGTMTGTIDAMSSGGTTPFNGTINKLFVSASIDDIVDHLAVTRFNSGSNTAIVFQSQTILNSTLFACRADFGEANYSSNPTYTDENGRIVVIEPGQEDRQKPFSFITGVGLYDSNNNLLGMAKLGRPLLKTPATAPTIKVRLDH